MVAERLRCSPWQLREVPAFWRLRALAALEAEAKAKNDRQQRDARRARMQRRMGRRR